MQHTTTTLLFIKLFRVFCLGLFLIGFSLVSNAKEKSVFEQNSVISLSQAVDEIAKTYVVSIIYDVDQLAKVEIGNWQIRKGDAEENLKSLLSNTGFSYQKLNEKTFAIKQNSVRKANLTQTTAAPIAKPKLAKVSGLVIDSETKEGILGVSIKLKDSNVGALSQEGGSFEIEASIGESLIFSFFGYLDLEVPIIRNQLGSVALIPDTKQLEEVVLIGYGTQKKSDLTGALSSITEEELKSLPNTGLDQAIQGRAAGVYVTQNSGAPGGGVSIRIRGIGSTLSAEPLYVIDGIPVVNDNQGTSTNFSELDGGGQSTNALNTINPSDIESIEVLKDASATAIYGARAANGVVLITTKRGKAGTSSISFESYFGIQQIAKKIPVMNLQEYAEYFNDIINFEEIEEFERTELLAEGTDWQDAVFRDARMQNYQLTLSGGNKQTRYAMSGSFHQKEGIVIGSKFSRFSSKINLDHNLSDRVRIGNSLLVSRTQENITFNDNSSGVVYTALLMVPSAPVRNADGSFAGPQEEITLNFDNPVARALDTRDINEKTRVLFNLYFEVDLLPWLKYRTEFGSDILYSNHSTFFPSFERGSFFGKSGVRENASNSFFWINKHLLTFNHTFAKKHTINALLGFEGQAGKYEYLFASRDNLPTNDLQSINLGDIGQQQTNGGAGHWALLSYFGRLNYNFDNRILLTGTVRVDGSSRFSPNNRYGIFPSGAIAWRISNEAFLKEVKQISNMKIRFGIGEVGNQEIGLYSYLANLRAQSAVFGNSLTTAFVPDNIANPEVRWESSFQTDIGLDVALFDNRIEFVADYYVKQADGMLIPALLPLTAGSLNPPFVNLGKIENRGIELAVTSYNFTGKFTWRSSVNFSRNFNKVISLGSNGNLIGIVQRLPVTRTVEGMPISQFYGYVTDGIFQSQDEVGESPFQAEGTRAGDIKFKDLNSDGVINDGDQTFIGSPLPDFTLNMTNDWGYKNFDLNLFIQGVYGNDILNLVRRDVEGMAGRSNQSIVAIDRWTPTNPSTDVPRADGNDPNDNRRISTRFVEDGSFVRIKNLTLGYTLPSGALKKLKSDKIRFYVSTQNLFTWTNYSGYDPEVGSYNQNPLVNGVENGRYPIARSITMGVNANF
ncbi:MAG: SusC/RagA family TonB-linked outer membrane protein [Bacteroidia bacterium]